MTVTKKKDHNNKQVILSSLKTSKNVFEHLCKYFEQKL